MRLKKRGKRSRLRGNRTGGWAMKKHKGSGNRGGTGMAGTGKRADQRKSWVIKYQFPYFGKQGFTSRATKKKINNVINLREIQSKYAAGEVNLKDYKILGDGDITGKYIIKAKYVSKGAREKIEKAGGKVILDSEAKKVKSAEKEIKLAEKKIKPVKKSKKKDEVRK